MALTPEGAGIGTDPPACQLLLSTLYRVAATLPLLRSEAERMSSQPRDAEIVDAQQLGVAGGC